MSEIIKEGLELTTEQCKSIDGIVDFIENGNPKEWFLLEGKAGTGKTTVISEVVKKYINKKRIIIAALSHKAKRVLNEKIIETCGERDPLRGVLSYSVSAMLAMKFDMETGEFSADGSRKDPKVRFSDIIFIDECSMINETALELIMEKKKKNAKVIFLGDRGQLPPIRKADDIDLLSEPSPTFKTENIFTLNQRVRQTENSTILKYSDYYWNNSIINNDVVTDPVPYGERFNNENMCFVTDLEGTIKDNIDKFKSLKNIKNINAIKVIVYKNATREMLNWYIRGLLYDEPKDYEVGDVLIFNDNYTAGGEDIIIDNSTEVTILSIKLGNFHGKYKGYILEVTDGKTVWNIDVIPKTTVREYNKYISELFKIAKGKPKGRGRTLALQRAWASRSRFANVDFGYCLTSHKSQGSTYNTVIVIEDDILNINLITDIEKSQSMYVAITRASDMVYVVSDLNK